jgi:hypothetical protein
LLPQNSAKAIDARKEIAAIIGVLHKVKAGEMSSKLPTAQGSRKDVTSSTRIDEVTKQGRI